MAEPLLGTFDEKAYKKRKHWRIDVEEEARNCAGSDNVILASYSDLLQRVFNSMQKNPEDDNRARKIALPNPQIDRKGKKTIFANFTTICDQLKRSPEHVKQYINTEQNADSSIDGNGALIISGRLQQSQIEKLMLNYILTYVQCPVCHSTDTKLEKQNRLQFIKCNTCTAQRAVQQIKGGFVANTNKRSRR
ncbi:Domain found in IF2B/IF5 family protein [Trichomonas vaginalis G3]|uniref:Domain found in IF2B/IF5 family protein n=1 Tax=Trichomonas vaginalis (strain ATCC PRA-98 / G3) TaxID=412133 RepID=A2DED8_TRIV3|nr:translation initiation factor protein [Trichomonas vaginalis G3]EAY21356.1 Domain found in IF2B/IF5 family protein [Trichomonas vaginalis G3]KAI5548906.1 translation initiation factor protein [Trichomonas vaginalis G3]|eukprot:XP_001582342.1 Domain found in IF2B/IF5 family protein [Trichomonas vaginalis G3]